MTNFPNSPRLLKAGLVLIDPATSNVAPRTGAGLIGVQVAQAVCGGLSR